MFSITEKIFGQKSQSGFNRQISQHWKLLKNFRQNSSEGNGSSHVNKSSPYDCSNI